MEELSLTSGIKTLQAPACANAFDGTTCLKGLEGVPVGRPRGQNQVTSSVYQNIEVTIQGSFLLPKLETKFFTDNVILLRFPFHFSLLPEIMMLI